MERLGFFGGCFNPVTKAHVSLIKDVIKKNDLDKVYFVPMGDLYSKEDLIPAKHRIAMLEFALQNEDKMEILNISNNNSKMSAIDSFKLIDEKFKNCERFFIMGSDNYKKIPNWKESEKLMKDYKYIILDRENGENKGISSSVVREKIKSDEFADDLISDKVVEYIKNNNLYR